MRRPLLAFLFLPLLALPAASQDDYELANALADRGWFDLAEELYTRIQNNSSLAPEKRSEGKYGLLKMKMAEARREPELQKREPLFNDLIAKVEEFIQAFPNHPRRAEALSDLGELHQEKGKLLLNLAKTDAGALGRAEKEFDAAEKLFSDQIEELNRNKPERPESAEDKAKMVRYEAWEQKIMFAKYNRGAAMFARAEAYQGSPNKRGEMKKKLEELNKFFYDFAWEFSQYLPAYDGFLLMGRACWILAESADRADAEKLWKQCFDNIGNARSLLSDPENRKSEGVRDLAVRAYYHEIRAHLAYGDTKKGGAAAKEYQKAVKLAEDLFRYYPAAKKEELGKAILLEQASAYCKAGDVKKGVELLTQLKHAEKDTVWLVNRAVDLLGEYAGENDLKLAVESADNIFDREELYRALQKYRRALAAIKTPDERKKWFPYCWFRIAECYYYLRRYSEAAKAVDVILYERSPYLNHDFAADAAMRKLAALQRLAAQTAESADQKAAKEYNTWVATQYPGRVDDGQIFNAALDAEKAANWTDAIKQWEQIAGKPKSKYYEVALHRIAYNYYRIGTGLLQDARDPSKKLTEADRKARIHQAKDNYEKALKRFETHLAFVDKQPTKEPRVAENAVWSTYYSCNIYVSSEIGLPQKALQISEAIEQKYPGADPKCVIAIMRARMSAKLRLDEQGYWDCSECKAPVKSESSVACPKCTQNSLRSYLQEAEEDLQVLKNKRDKEGQGKEDYLKSLALLAQAFEARADALRGTDVALSKEYKIQAANYYYLYFQDNPEKPKGEQMEIMAEKLYAAAGERLDRSGRLEDPKEREKAAKEAKVLFERARDLFETFLELNETEIAKKDPHRVKMLKRLITSAAAKSGHFDQAITSLEVALKDEDPANPRDGSAWEDLADCLLAKAESMPSGEARDTLYKRADEIYGTLAAALLRNQKIDQHFYRLLYNHARILQKTDPDGLKVLFDQMDIKGYGKLFGCEKCRRKISVLDLKGGTACLYDRCGACGRSTKRGSVSACDACKSAVAPCGNATLVEFGWDDRLRFECAPSFACADWRCGNVVRETEFARLLCGKCRCVLAAGDAVAAGKDCSSHVKCDKCKKAFLKGETCPEPGCGGKLAADACGAKASLRPLCTRCGKEGMSKVGCGTRFGALMVEDLRRLKCVTCEKAFAMSRALESSPQCEDPKCKGRLKEIVECGKCRAPDTVVEIRDWVAADWERGQFRDKFEEIRTDLKQRLAPKKPGGNR